MEEEERFPPLSSSFVLKDISNLKTPKRITKNPQFFTTCNETPRSSSSFRYRSRPSLVPSSSRSKAKAKLKAFQLERSQSACKEQLKKDRSLKSLAKSLTALLNFLFQNPEFCGCDLSINGCNESNVVRVDSAWKSPKRMRALWWRGEESENVVADVSSLKYSSLSFDELKQRMQVYLSLVSCKEVFNVMTQVAKNIDGGRLTMKANCPIVTDVGIKEKATKILMSYNPIWLRIGLYIIFGGDSLISPEGDLSSVKDISFLKMIIEKQFFSHTGLAKAYAYNKKVEGLYRPGFYENLGNIILKRTLLLVLILDRAKSQTSLPLNYGIDGVDGGSPLLFTVSSGIKSSRQVLNNFLSSDVMHGEGDLAHLVTVGYKVSHQQSALVEFDFQVSDLFLDLQDGVRLCRVIQLLRHDSSILMKIVVPSDTHKKNLANCGVALQYLREAGVMLCDEDGLKITRDDVADRDTELTLSLLWNIFVRLQLPLLIDRTTIASEISKIRGFNMAICENYGLKVDSFSSLVNRKAIWCLLDYYFRRELSCSNKVDSHETRDEKSIMSTTDYTDAVHNFVLSQKLTAILGKFPEVLQISDLLEHNGAVSEKSVVVLLTFILSQLIVKKNVDQLNFHKMLGCNCQTLERRRHSLTRRRSASTEAIVRTDRDLDITEDATKKFKIIQAWWRDMTERNYKSVVRPAASTSSCFPARKTSIDILREKAAIVIQSHFRRFIERHNFLKMTKAIGLIQTVTRAWLTVKKNSALNKFRFAGVPEVPSEVGRLVKFIGERHSFHVARIWVAQRRDAACPILIKAAIVIQKCFRGWVNASFKYEEKSLSIGETEAASRIQIAWKNFVCRYLQKQTYAATKIQSHYRAWQLRRSFIKQKQEIIKIQSNFRRLKCWWAFQIAQKEFVCRSLQNQTFAATKIQKQKQAIIAIQSKLRQLKCSNAFQQYKMAARSAIIIQSCVRRWIAQRRALRCRYLTVAIQRHCRGWLVRKDFSLKRDSVIKIQRAIRCLICQKAFHLHKLAAIDIQRVIRGQLSRSRLLGASSFHVATAGSYNCKMSKGFFQSFELKLVITSVLKLQRWWRGVMLLKLRTKSAIIIQSHARGWIAKRETCRQKHCIVVIQSYWKGYVARKESREQLLNLRLRMQKSAMNVDDSRRLINRLLSALSELLSMKSIRGILHNCETLDMATAHSLKCCEELVAAGAITILLKLIRAASRSIPDQQVLKHALSTLRNLARYPHLTQVLIDTPASVETILWELHRNKEEGYFIASQILKKICSNENGVITVHKFPALLKRLYNLVEELTRKAYNEKRNPRAVAVRDNTDRRLKEAVELLKLITNGYKSSKLPIAFAM
ncbi:hypothetical protein E1A91_A10G014700v1 [Gossypium mustelinum]|uniref:Calponin-homology (CH) domain-containing protein n=1 Tax=Gossypium mustelinum TaxID=34275 RepID=A0A5D2XFZ7_GOSMU|nr:hypothetical protein E1A91_A10G014700v1 [Gossypium mustelinum]